MSASAPQLHPNAAAAASSTHGPSAPGAMPPAVASQQGGCGCGGAAAAAASFAPPAALATSNDAAPTLPVGADGVSAAIGAWNNNKRITALWSINQNRNAWIHVDGVGWKRLSTASESGIVALARLTAHARERNSAVNYRDEADGMVHEIYVW